jgi:hypothetical protein
VRAESARESISSGTTTFGLALRFVLAVRFAGRGAFASIGRASGSVGEGARLRGRGFAGPVVVALFGFGALDAKDASLSFALRTVRD